MLYKFKSKNAGDLIMLEPHGRRILEVIGKDTGATGIILPEQMPAAIEKETQGQVLNSYFRRARSWGWIRAITRVMRVTRHEGQVSQLAFPAVSRGSDTVLNSYFFSAKS